MSMRWVLSRKSVLAAGAMSFTLLAGVSVAEETSFDISLSGGEAGDQDGAGEGTLTIDDETNQVSWDFGVSNIGEPTAMHIHEGGAGESGGVVVPLTVEKDEDGRLVGLASADAEAVKAILAAPSNYYVNVHTGEHRGGAVRGQLEE